MSIRSRHRHLRKLLLSTGTTLAMVVGILFAVGTSQAAASLPCDIYAAAGTPCVAAHSTTRALFEAYNGPLYQVKRASDSTTLNIDTLTAGGYADAAAQNSFCAGTTCIITEIYDQSSEHNNLTIEGPGGRDNPADVGANAAALPVTVGGHQVYGLYVAPGVGYRDDSTKGVATGADPQGAYMVASGTHVNGGCCFDYGNAETDNKANGNGHMDAVNFSTECWFSPCSGSGPWVQADLENGLFAGANGSDTNNKGNSSTFVTALVKDNGTTTYAIKGGNAQSGGLTTWYDGALPDASGYAPMRQEGAIVLGTGGDDSNLSAGSFFEGVMTAGYPTDAADNAVQADIVAAGYLNGATTSSGVEVHAVGAGQCLDVPGASTAEGTQLDIWDCSGANNQLWTNTSAKQLTVYGGADCLDAYKNDTAPGTAVDIWPCNGGTNQEWAVNSNGTITSVQSGLCLDVTGASTKEGALLDIWTCNGQSNQQWALN